MAKQDVHLIFSKSADPKSAATDFERFAESCAKARGAAPKCDADGMKILVRIFGNSRTLAGRLIANPAWADDIALSPYLAAKKPAAVFDEELGFMLRGATGDKQAFCKILRDYKYREMTRIVARDLSGLCGAAETLAEWSDLADSLIGTAYSYTLSKLITEFGGPVFTNDSGAAEPCRGAIMALGKLGGRELNLSSDVDLIVLYSSDNGCAELSAGISITNHEFFVKLTAEMTNILSAVTPDGFVFRVDHDLRPEGAQGTLANSIDAAVRYYQYFGHDWERQALIRARPVAGDIGLGNIFLQEIRPFVFRRRVAISDLAGMRRMKLQMEKEAGLKHECLDIKHSAGGIREAEFFVQAHQLLYGGTHPSVRTPNTFDAIERLRAESIIHPYAADALAEGYAFLRRLENMIQAEDDLQAHRLQADKANGLARRMGLESGDQLNALLERHMGGIRRLVSALFEADYELQEFDEAIRGNLDSCSDDEERLDSLAWFKEQEANRIRRLDLDGKIPIEATLRKLSSVADVVLRCALELALSGMRRRFGMPMNADGSAAGFAIVGMGRLGSREMDYGSDLDILFLYSGDGQSDGDSRISNFEYFTRLAQRIISIASLPTRYGKAYVVDSELRPSGGQGVLVTTMGSFRDYHMTRADIWERQSLLRARLIASCGTFAEDVAESISAIAYRSPAPPPEAVRSEILRLKDKAARERRSAAPGHFNVKSGDGGVGDLESVIQFHHLTNIDKFDSLKRQNSFEVVEALGHEGIIDEATFSDFADILRFYRSLMSYLRLIKGRQAETLDANADYIDHLATLMRFKSKEELLTKADAARKKTRRLFKDVILAGMED